MSSLWSQTRVTINNAKNIPSPNHTRSFLRFAQAACLKFYKEIHKFFHICIPGYINYGIDSIERISLHIPHRQVAGSMTVEACIVLPLFLFCFVNLLSSIEMIRLHGNLQVALRETGNKLSLYGYITENCEQAVSGDEDYSDLNQLLEAAFTYSYLKADVIKNGGKKYLDQSPLVFGADGLHFFGSNLLTDTDEIEINMSYGVAPPFPMVFVRPFLMTNRYYSHLWNGYRIPGTDEDNGKKEYYYVAEYGDVFHTTRECSYLKISKRTVSLEKLPSCVNESGEHYSPCSKCKKTFLAEKVWITDHGEHYHFNEACPGLSRTVYVITKKETAAYRPCNRCGE